jgi:hypothetical protein
VDLGAQVFGVQQAKKVYSELLAMPAGAVSSSSDVLRNPWVEKRRVAVSSNCSVIRDRSSAENADGTVSPYEQIGFLFTE